MKRAISLLSQIHAQQLDQDLMSISGAFSIDQLMELAGFSVASVVHYIYPYSRVLCIVGPGNNGGDGLVAARHLAHFGHSVSVCMPKATTNALYLRLIEQCKGIGIAIDSTLPKGDAFDLIVDAIFGFSFKGAIRTPFDEVINKINSFSLPIVSVDIPSGWDVEKGPANDNNPVNASVLVSLTAPKQCASLFTGRHFLGGRFVPSFIKEKYDLVLPPYIGSNQFVEFYLE